MESTAIEAGKARTRLTGALVSGALVLIAVAVGTYFVLEALEERSAAAHASRLQLAALTISAADALADTAPIPTEQLLPAVDELQQNHDEALHALAPEDRARAIQLTEEIAHCGVLLADGITHEAHNHGELQSLLEAASAKAGAGAAEAERWAALSLLVVVATSASAGAFVLRSHFRTVNDRNVTNTRLRAGQRLERLLNDSPDIFFVLDSEGLITYRSNSSTKLFAGDVVSSQELLGIAANPGERRVLGDHLSRAQSGAARTFELRGNSGNVGFYELRISDLTADELVAGRLVTARNISKEVELRRDLHHQATTDALTGLPNRRALEPTIAAATTRMAESQQPLALLVLDLDGFKDVNDALGHEVGDKLLIQVAEKLRSTMRDEDDLLRLGGDEFAVVLPGLSGADHAVAMAGRVLAALDESFDIGPRSEKIAVSVGAALARRPEEVADLIAQADIAMYESKRAGGNGVVLFEEGMASRASRPGQITRALRAAELDHEFKLVYQPIVEADTDRISSYEALLRWDSPVLGAVTPDEFIPIAERSGEICTIGRWVFDNVCRQLAEWRQLGADPDLAISWNVSPRELNEDAFVPCITAIAAHHGIPLDRVIIEVTESSILDDGGLATERLNQLRAIGLRISIDDFGSGYSNLGQLLQVPFDIIKVDRSLLMTLSEMRQRTGGDSTDACAIMQAIVSIAELVGSPVVCEGVETEEQRLSLTASGVRYLQGYHTGRPSPPESITTDLPGRALTVS